MGKGEETKQSKQALYRQYRSASFDEVVGQEHITELLKTAVKNGSVSHAYLFTGPRGTGKTSVARILAFAANNLPYSHNAQHLDIIEIDAASNRRIDDIRDLREKVHIAPTSAPYKVYIIDEVHMLTSESFNALLKTLEEPPAHAIFILATTELHKVPATIISRTQRFHFRPVSQKKVVDHLATIAQKEGISIDQTALELVADHGGGSFRDSISLLDQLGGLGQPITAELVESILGRANSKRVSSLIEALAEHDEAGIRTIVDELVSGGVSPVTLSEQLVRNILSRSDLGFEWYALVEKLMDVPRAHFAQLSLVTQLLQFAGGRRQPIPVVAAETTEHVAPTPVAPEPAVTPEDKPVKQPTPKASAETNTPDLTPPAPEKTVPEPQAKPRTDGTFDWDKVLAAAKKSHAPLYSVLSRATMSFDKNTVTLGFQYALHRKKLEQPQYRTQLARLIEDVCGINPEVRIEGDAQHIAANETTKAVADIMGGGDVVTV